METIKKLLKITIVFCLVMLVIVPVVAFSDFEEDKGEKSGLTLTEAKEKMIEIANSGQIITDTEDKFLNNIYEDFSDNVSIFNMYHYCYADYYYYQYENISPSSQGTANKKNEYLWKAKNEIENIDTKYVGAISNNADYLIKEIKRAKPVEYHDYNNSKPSSSNSNSNSNGYSAAYNSLTYSDKVDICRFIKNSYEYYDKKEGRDTGDKYSDQIWREVMKEYGITEIEVTIIWMNSYTNNYLP